MNTQVELDFDFDTFYMWQSNINNHVLLDFDDNVPVCHNVLIIIVAIVIICLQCYYRCDRSLQFVCHYEKRTKIRTVAVLVFLSKDLEFFSKLLC